MTTPDLVREQTFERSLPNSAEAERAVLGAIILDNSVISTAVELLKPDDFYVPSHRRIFTTMITLFERGSEINSILISEELRKDNSLENVGGQSFVTNMTYGLPHSTNIAHYAKLVRGKTVLRQLIKAANKIVNEALEEDDLPETVLEHSSKAIFDITLEHTVKSFSNIYSLAHASLTKTYEIQQSGVALTGLSTGFVDIDSLTLGLQASDLIIVAGRPSMGKSSIALMMAQNAAIRNGANVAFFSLEMPEEQLTMRVLCSEARLDSRRYRNGFISPEEWDKLNLAYQSLSQARLWIDDTPGISVLQLKAKAMRLAVEHDYLDLVVVDYIGLMAGSGKRFGNRQEEVAQISKDLKQVAKELKVPLVAVSQLNRSPENRTDHRPQLSDLRESGALEMDADVVMLLYRGDKYRPLNETPDHTAEVNIAKQRNGPTDTVVLRFDSVSTRFDNYQTN